MSLSRTKRWRVRFPVQIVASDFFDHACSLDVSVRGLRVTTARSLQPGTQVYVRLLLPDGKRNVDFQLCTVRWARDGSTGLEATEMTAEEQAKLQAYMASVGNGSEPAVPLSTPCIASDKPVSGVGDAVKVLWGLLVSSDKDLITPNVRSR